jgi:hypothetical protein
MPYASTIVAVRPVTTNGEVTAMTRQKERVPADVTIQPGADPMRPYRLDGTPRYPETPPFAIQPTDEDRAFEVSFDLFERLCLDVKSHKGTNKAVFDEYYARWLNNMTTLSISHDDVESVVPLSAEQGRHAPGQPVYPSTTLRRNTWIVVLGDVSWEVP